MCGVLELETDERLPRPSPDRSFQPGRLFVGVLSGTYRELFIDNLLVRIHFIIGMIRWTGFAPWEFEIPFPGSLTSTFLVASEKLNGAGTTRNPFPAPLTSSLNSSET